jgi:hypothetical protein
MEYIKIFNIIKKKENEFIIKDDFKPIIKDLLISETFTNFENFDNFHKIYCFFYSF